MLIKHSHYKTREEAKTDIIKYIVLFYNQQRIMKGLDFKTSSQMAEDLYGPVALIFNWTILAFL